MAPTTGDRLRGRFVKKSKLQWIESVITANKRRTREKRHSDSEGHSVRVICELNQQADDLWCESSDRPLSLRYIENERVAGLVTSLSVRCDQCLLLHNVQTCKKAIEPFRVGRPVFDVNKKAAIGMLDSGCGPTKVNTFLSALNIRPPTENTLKRHERSVGKAVENVATESCFKALKLEKELTKKEESNLSVVPHTDSNFAPTAEGYSASTPSSLLLSSWGNGMVATSTPNGDTASPTDPPSFCSQSYIDSGSPGSHPEISSDCLADNNALEGSSLTNEETPKQNSIRGVIASPPTNLRVSFDAGWQKRGNQKSYNSKTGHASAVGYFSKKLLGYATRKTACRLCTRGISKENHDCRKNFKNSAKAMEADMALSILAFNPLLEAENCIVGVLIGDDDSSTIANLRRSVSHNIEKWSDLNHAKKGVSNALYGLKGNLKLSTCAVKYLSRNFGYAIKKNYNQPEKVREAIKVSVDHAFDKHDKCGSWCTFSQNPKDYRHSGLPHGKGLEGAALYEKLTELFGRYAKNAERLAPCGSSQANESFNSTVMRKHPKSEFYGGSESIDFRVASAVCQKNEGTQYVTAWNVEAKLSPGKETMRFREKKDKKREQESRRKKSVHYKKRRLWLKGKQHSSDTSKEQKEGVAYESESAISGVEFLIDNPESGSGDSALVMFDLETSGFGKEAEICQIAAACRGNIFNTYIVPSKGIPPKVTEITGLTARGGDLYLRGQLLQTTPPRLAILSFISYLKEISSKVTLVAHNCYSFDARQLINEVKKQKMLQDFCEVVVAFSDTLPIFKSKLPERKKNKEKYTQVALANSYGIFIEDAHNAVSDVQVLGELVKNINVSEAELRISSKPVHYFANADLMKTTMNNFCTVMAPAASKTLTKKMFDAGIDLGVLQSAHRTDQENGVRLLLSQSIGGNARVTGNPRVIKKIVNHLAALQQRTAM